MGWALALNGCTTLQSPFRLSFHCYFPGPCHGHLQVFLAYVTQQHWSLSGKPWQGQMSGCAVYAQCHGFSIPLQRGTLSPGMQLQGTGMRLSELLTKEASRGGARGPSSERGFIHFPTDTFTFAYSTRTGEKKKRKRVNFFFIASGFQV